MQIRNYDDVPVIPYAGGIAKRVMLGPKQGAPTFVMRIFDLPPGAASPWHQHDWEHEVFILAGKGLAVSKDGETPIRRGDAIFLPPNQMHCLKNTGLAALRFMSGPPAGGGHAVGPPEMDIPTLTTARLTLRPFAAQDGDALYQILQQEGVLRYFPRPEPPPRERVDQFIADQLRRWERDGFGRWAMELRARPGLIGWAGLHYLPETDEVELGYLLGKVCWGQGLATEAGLASLNYGFETLKVAQIVAIVHRENAASQRVLQKLGMRCDCEAVYWGMPAFHYVMDSPKKTIVSREGHKGRKEAQGQDEHPQRLTPAGSGTRRRCGALQE